MAQTEKTVCDGFAARAESRDPDANMSIHLSILSRGPLPRVFIRSGHRATVGGPGLDTYVPSGGLAATSLPS